MNVPSVVFEELKTAIGFRNTDVEILRELGTMLEKHLSKLMDKFYSILEKFQGTTQIAETHVAQLSKIHKAWLNSLFVGDYGAAYFENRCEIAKLHANLGMDFYWLEGMVSLIQTVSLEVLVSEVKSVARYARYAGSLSKLLAMELSIFNLAYNQDKIERIAVFTGMKSIVLENIARPTKR